MPLQRMKRNILLLLPLSLLLGCSDSSDSVSYGLAYEPKPDSGDKYTAVDALHVREQISALEAKISKGDLNDEEILRLKREIEAQLAIKEKLAVHFASLKKNAGRR